MHPSVVRVTLAWCIALSGGAALAQSKDITNQMPQVRQGQMINAAPTPAKQSSPIQMSPDGSKGNIPITKDTSLYGQKDPTAKPGEIKVQGGVEIKTK